MCGTFVRSALNRHLSLLNQTPTDRLPAALRMDLLESRGSPRPTPKWAAVTAIIVLLGVAGIAYSWFRSGWPFSGSEPAFPPVASTSQDASQSQGASKLSDATDSGARDSGTKATGTKDSVAGPLVAAADRLPEVRVAKSSQADCHTVGEAIRRVAAGGTIRIIDSAQYEE